MSPDYEARAKRMVTQAQRNDNPALREILAVHHVYHSPHGLPESFGDAFLVAKNPIFGAIRELAIAFGFTFTPDANDYMSWTLMALDDIVRDKHVPYLSNVRAIEALERRRPDHFRASILFSFPPHGNVVIHESTHGIVHELLKPHMPTAQSDPETFVLAQLLMEASANAIDLLSGMAIDDVTHQVFHTFNCYMPSSIGALRWLNELQEELGLFDLLRLSIYLYLFSNFCYAELSDYRLNAILVALGAPKRWRSKPRWWKLVRQLCESALELSEGFRMFTTSMYLAGLGIDTPISQLTKRSPLQLLHEQPQLTRGIEIFAQLVASNVEKRPPALRSNHPSPLIV